MIAATRPIGVDALLTQYRSHKKTYETHKIQFTGISGFDVYNISKRFVLEGIAYIAGRVETRDSEISSVMFFREVGPMTYALCDHIPAIPQLQDPCISFYRDEIIVGGTYIDIDEQKKIVGWRTRFYRGKHLENLKQFADAPFKMKDVRFIEYQKKIALFSRPQGGVAGPGKIGFSMLESIDAITEKNILDARLIETHFIQGEWGGANDIHLLKNGLIGVLGHISKRDEHRKLHYYPMVFAFDPVTMQSSDIRIIAERIDFAEGPSKRDDLKDVLFSGGLVRHQDGKATLYTGVSDAEAHLMVLEDPFIPYE